ncbi:CBS domain-containing protein [Frankia sp. EI5c]|uniref:hemolysin family protein n=1 Tax=Frankia sp. EI5c TaxID=683316 RepID=UPI0007C3D22D|nr:hemolysin family protein [Frankia sp. EI5c]OAA24897.1 CBS domain-containing protein [Frankia sp. EI5c]
MTALAILAGLLLLAGNAFFVGAEFALISARRDRVAPLVQQGDRRAAAVLTHLEHLSPMLAATQLGITVCSLALGAVAEPAVAHLLASGLAAAGVPHDAQHVIAFAVALVIVVSLHMVLGEMVPKNLSIAGPERAALWLGPPLFAFARMTRPFIAFLNQFANAVLRLLRVTPSDELSTAYTPEELGALIGQSRQEGLLHSGEHELLTHALELSGRTASSVMIPRAEIVTVPWTVTATQLEQVVAETGFSRFPVRAPAADSAVAGSPPGPPAELVGFLHAKDVLGIAEEARDEPLPPHRLRPMVRIPVGLRLDETLRLMQRTNSHLGRAVDAAGTTLGVVAMEDVVEEFVGEVEDASHRGTADARG